MTDRNLTGITKAYYYGQREEVSMNGYFAILAAIPGFFLSSLFVMLFSRVLGPIFGFDPVGYPTAMLVTIALWIAVAPLVAARKRRR